MIRLATVEDLPELVRLGAAFHGMTIHAKFADYDPDRFEFYCKHLLGSANAALWIGKDAMLAASVAQHPASSALYAYEVFLYSEGAKQSLGLLKTAKAWAKERGAVGVILSDQMSLRSLAKLYERVGAVPLERHYILEV